jgi:hypothetical protein
MRGFGDMLDAYLEPPDESDECEHDEDELCRRCDPEGYADYMADRHYAESKEER